MECRVRQSFERDLPKTWIKLITKIELSCLCISKGMLSWTQARKMCCLKKDLWICWRKKKKIYLETKMSFDHYLRKRMLFSYHNSSSSQCFLDCNKTASLGKSLFLQHIMRLGHTFSVYFLVSAHSLFSSLSKCSLFYLYFQCADGSGKFLWPSVKQKIREKTWFSSSFSAQNFLRSISTVNKGTLELPFHTRDS